MNAVELLAFIEARIEDDRREAQRRSMSYAGPEIEDFFVDSFGDGWTGTRTITLGGVRFAARFTDHPDYRQEWKP